jgi:AraC-like DNA-binding protein
MAGIAACFGYSSVATFVRAFHRWTGMTPEEFRDRGVLRAPEAGETATRVEGAVIH